MLRGFRRSWGETRGYRGYPRSELIGYFQRKFSGDTLLNHLLYCYINVRTVSCYFEEGLLIKTANLDFQYYYHLNTNS